MRSYWVGAALLAVAVAGYCEHGLWLGDPPGPVAGQAKDAAGTGSAKGGGRGGGGPVTVQVAVARVGTLPVLRQTTGTVLPISSAALSGLVAGSIAEIKVQDGADVQAGDVLVRLDDRALRAALGRDLAAIARDQAAVDNAQATYDRTQKLTGSTAYSQQAADDAQAALREANATLALDKAAMAIDQVTLDNTEIRAPFAGRIGAVLLSPGAYVAAGTPIVTLTEMHPVHAEFTLPETDLAAARAAQAEGKLTATVTPLLNTPANVSLTGPVTFIDNAVDAASGTIAMRADLANDGNVLWPQQALSVEVTLGEIGNLALVPGVAVTPGQAGSTVFVVKPDNSVEVRPVTVALRVGDMAGISDGLKPGEAVVTEGQLAVAAGTKVAVAADKPAGAGAGAADAKTPSKKSKKVKQ